MTQAVELVEYLKGYPTFNNTTLKNKLGKSSAYTNLILHRLRKRGLIRKIEKNKYTVSNDLFLVASRIVWPSYISCWSALKYHNLTEQIPHDITVITTVSRKSIVFNNARIRFVKTQPKNFFGYTKVRHDNSEVFVADAEKSIIDSALLREVSFSELQEVLSNNIKKVRTRVFLKYLKKIGNKSLIKRFGYVLETLGKDYHAQLRKYVDATYIPLDYSKKPRGEKNKKWRLTVNA